jgi:hypothetical protein
MPNLPILHEMEIEISNRDNDSYPIHISFIEKGSYPPDPRRFGSEIFFPSYQTGKEGISLGVHADLIETAASSVDKLSEVVNWSDSPQALEMRAAIRNLGDALFNRLDQSDAFTEFLSRASTFQFYGMPESFCRISILFDRDEPMLARVPWELMEFRGEELRQRCAIVRRIRRSSGEWSGSFDLPLNVALSNLTNFGMGNIEILRRYLFDEFAEVARNYGGIQWDDARLPDIKLGEAHHVVFSSSDPDSLHKLETGIEFLRKKITVTRLWSVAPRLLVLHDISAKGPGYGQAHLVHQALAGGADAVLLKTQISLPHSDDVFFRAFYRKIMHNWPLDQCLWAAQGAAIQTAVPVDWIFGARKEGEFGLLLTRAVLEATQQPLATTAPPVRRKRSFPQKGMLPEVSPDARFLPEMVGGVRRKAPPETKIAGQEGTKIAGQEGTKPKVRPEIRPELRPEVRPEVAPELRPEVRPELAPEPTILEAAERPSRVADELSESLRRMAEDRRQNVFATMAEKVRGITFDEEEHGVAELINVRATVPEVTDEVARDINEAEELAHRIEIGSSPESLQQATVRLTNLWITDERSPDGPTVITEHHYLVSQRPYELHLQIGPRHEGALVSERFNEESLQKVFEKVEQVQLDVMFFATDEDFELSGPDLDLPSKEEWASLVELEMVDGEKKELMSKRGRWGRHAKLLLPRFGRSTEVIVSITPLNAGKRRLRTCIYYRNVMLQSVLLEAEVAEEGSEQSQSNFVSEETTITGRVTDYVATMDFALLDDLPQPSLNIFTNYDDSGTHWVGAYSSGETGALQFQSGDMRTFDKDLLETRAGRMREILIEIEGEKKSYKLDAKLPLSEEDIKRREGYLRELALSGWRLYHPLFVVAENGDDNEDNAARLKKFRNNLQQTHIVSIARCGPNSATLPWAALYSNHLDRNREDEIALCGVFKEQLAANKWDGDKLIEKRDLLDEPDKCRSLPNCPLSTDKKKVTICPFGFWGFIHQVEQPLQQVKPTPVDEEPKELKNYNFGQTSFLIRSKNDPLNLAIGAYPGIPDAADHKKEIGLLNKVKVLPMEQDTRDQIMSLINKGGQHVYYFYCHGDVDKTEKIFRLKLGPSEKPGYIESSDLDPDEINWNTPKPLVIMNGCETMAVTPDVTHGFLNTLKMLGASGIIGTEIKVWTQLARPFGFQLLKYLLEGFSVGEAFLEIRKNLLRQYNPLGLVYSYYSPATLHLHDPAGCKWCEAHQM